MIALMKRITAAMVMHDPAGRSKRKLIPSPIEAEADPKIQEEKIIFCIVLWS